ncbi:hypothetical protein SNE40_012969 [Patella caerulea]|uniref:Chitin-binding type-2 domain-containing protein n=2 Tax=Patella caerulea TaxID=87958 RepID=A0AAN8JH67_PATCE
MTTMLNVVILMASILVSTRTAEGKQYTVSASTHNFNFLPPTNYTAVCAKAKAENKPFIVHPYSCRILVTCNELSGKVSFTECPTDDVMYNAYYSCNRVDNHYKVNCIYDETNNPCSNVTNRELRITDGKTCNGYYECDPDTGYNSLRKMTCDEGQRFDFKDGCVPDSTCVSNGAAPSALPTRINATCSGVANDVSKYLLTEFYEINGLPEYRSTEVSCPASMEYDEGRAGTEFCCSNRVDNVNQACEPMNLVRGTSVNNGWQLALGGHETSFSKIEGNATIVDNTNTQFNGWAYFDGEDMFSATKMSDNELRYYWNMTFDFQAGEMSDGTVVVGIQPGGKVALIDNSACGAKPTYGCQIEVESLNRGVIECFANSHTVRTNSRDLTKTQSVVFKRDRTIGTMMVSTQGQSTDTRTFSFQDNEVISGNDCSLAIGTGYQTRNFIGFMDNVMFYKNCQ